MTVRKLTADRCPDHPESRTHFTKDLTANPLGERGQYEILQYFCGEEGCPQKLGWVYEGPQETLSGSGACPERLVHTVKAEKHKIDSLLFITGVGLASALMLFVLYIAITASSNQVWSLIHWFGMSTGFAITTLGLWAIQGILKRGAPMLKESG